MMFRQVAWKAVKSSVGLNFAPFFLFRVTKLEPPDTYTYPLLGEKPAPRYAFVFEMGWNQSAEVPYLLKLRLIFKYSRSP